MRLDKEHSYIFHDIDRHGVFTNNVKSMFVNDFTLLARFEPDYEYINKVLEERKNNPKFKDSVYNKQCIIGKNGKHIGLFFTSLIDDSGDIVYNVEYEWWQNPNIIGEQKPEEDECVAVRFWLGKEPIKTFDVVVEKYNGEFKVNLNGETISEPHTNIIDYSNSFVWVGAANRLLDDTDEYDHDFACVYTGDLLLLHNQEAKMFEKTKEIFFKDYKKFKDKGFKTKEDVVYVSTDFSEVTPYKVRDFSGNGTHPLLYNKEWIG